MARTLYVLSYDYVADILDRRGPHRPGHLALIEQWNATGRLPLAGALGDPLRAGLLVFDVGDPKVIDEFVAADPYVAEGLVSAYRVEPLTAVTP